MPKTSFMKKKCKIINYFFFLFENRRRWEMLTKTLMALVWNYFKKHFIERMIK